MTTTLERRATNLFRLCSHFCFYPNKSHKVPPAKRFQPQTHTHTQSDRKQSGYKVVSDLLTSHWRGAAGKRAWITIWGIWANQDMRGKAVKREGEGSGRESWKTCSKRWAWPWGTSTAARRRNEAQMCVCTRVLFFSFLKHILQDGDYSDKRQYRSNENLALKHQWLSGKEHNKVDRGCLPN